MKTTFFFLLTIASITLANTILMANDGKYLEAMQKNIKAIYEAQAIPDYQQAVNGFERIGAAEKTKWEPFYYASYGYVMMSTREKDNAKKDGYLDQATGALSKARELAPNDSEIIAMEGFIYMLRLAVDPGTRGQQYAGLATQTLSKAVAVDNNNPRALSLLAQMQFGTAQFFGSPTTEACGNLTLAIDKFSTFKSDNPLAPQWGKSMTESLKKKCN